MYIGKHIDYNVVLFLLYYYTVDLCVQRSMHIIMALVVIATLQVAKLHALCTYMYNSTNKQTLDYGQWLSAHHNIIITGDHYLEIC